MSGRLAARAEASILHADLDSFFASVEQRDDPRLRGRPVAVGGGVVLAASYEAKAFGVGAAMGGRQARALCPSIVFVPPRMEAYTEASRRVFEIFADTSPIVEGLSVDEAWLDVGGLRRIAGPPGGIAARLRARVREEVGLPITVGVARTKFLAKVASAVGKPDGLLVVEPAREIEFLHALPVERLWGVGPKTAAKLHAVGLFRVADVAALDDESLVALLGPATGRHVGALANNRDPRPVVVGRRRSSIGSQHAIGRAGVRKSPAELDAVLLSLVDRVTRRMRSAQRTGRTVSLRLRYDDFTKASRAATLPYATCHTETVLAAARQLLADAMPVLRERGVTLVGISVSNLDSTGAVQLPLPFGGAELGAVVLDSVVDDLRQRFGSAIVTKAALLGRRPGIEMPMLPD